ncbi:oligosaccharide flippase family protein [Stygiobacter electus]|uniref:Oligosaccharide flippase family protein n=1 Tax=Stygiobacter electus TaxID=3032292 RepID=A0AAE3P2N8_9BACT|nr:oligosaccharide flippase family protein [Stygiobacter electus]MDF1611978.1 oligosaccharide flippase family protein [Stygiobacter electus]
MLYKIKNTLQQTFIYSLSNIALKASGLILLPLYLRTFSVAQFGVWDLLDTSIQILAEILILGQASAIIFLNNSEEYKNQKSSALFSVFIFLTLFISILISAVEIINYSFPNLFNGELINFDYLRISSFIILLRVISNLFFSKIRADEEAKYYTALNILRIVLIISLTIFFVSIKKYGIYGALLSFLISEILIFLILLVKMIPQMKLKFNSELLRVALIFGLPLVLSSAGFMILNLSDRYIIKWLIGAKYVAIYGLGYRIAGVLNMFLILPFNLSLLPLAYKYFGKENDKRFYSKLMTYSTFFFVWGFVVLSLFSPEIIFLFAGKGNYESSFFVIPIILLSYVFSGMRLTAQLGMLLTKNTKHIAWITIAAAVLNIVLNLVFIPSFGIIAAAVNTLVSFLLFYIVTQIVSNIYYKIPFENFKLVLMILLGLLLSLPVYFFSQIKIEFILLKLLLVLLFPFVLFIFKFYEKAELEILTSKEKIVAFTKDLFSINIK